MPKRRIHMILPNNEAVDFDEETSEALLKKARDAGLSPKEYIQKLIAAEYDKVFSKN